MTFEEPRGCPTPGACSAIARLSELALQFAELKAAFRVNMLRRALPGEDIDAEIDRALAAIERSGWAGASRPDPP